MKNRNRIISIGSALLASLCLAVPVITSAEIFALCAGPVPLGGIPMPDATTVPSWGFSLGGETAGTCDNPPMVPGPELRTTDTSVTINLTNTLSGPVSLVIPGQVQQMTPVFDDATFFSTATNRVRSFTKETASLATVAYTWNDVKPGTFAYQSGTHPQVQIQMGLYGAVIVEVAAGEAYPGVEYDNDVVLFFSEIDPALHAAVVGGDYGVTMTSTITYVPKYFLINGAGYDPAMTPGAQAQAIGGPGSRTLLRFLNMGLRQHTPILQGSHVQLIAEAGSLYPFVREQYSVMLPPGQTRDALFDVPIDAVGGDLFPLYDHAMGLTNNTQSDGGMLAYLEVGGTAVNRPDVAITAPANGTSVVTGDPVTFMGTAIDVEDGDLSSTLAWNSSIDGALGTGASVGPTTTLSVGAHTITASATDSGSLTGDAQITLTITSAPVNAPPVVTITGPADGTSVITGTSLTFTGTAIDAEDGNLGVSMAWNSSLDGALGTGTSVGPTVLSIGTHTITASATDSGSLTGDAQITVTIDPVPANVPPVAEDDFLSVPRKPKGVAQTDPTNTHDIDLVFNDTDSDGSIVPTSVNILSLPASGNIIDNGDGTVSYQPARRKGTFNLTYTVDDNDGATSNVATLRINVTN